MSGKRSLILIAAGALLGAIVTTLLFSLCDEPADEPPGDEHLEDGDAPANVVPDEDPLQSNADATPPSLEGDCVLSGSIIDPDGDPAEGALVRVRVLDVPWSVADTPFEARTGKDGVFSFEGLNGDLRYQLWAWKEGSAVTGYEDAVCGSKTHLILEAGGAISFQIDDPEGEPASGAEIILSGSSLWPARTARASEDGTVVITGLSEGFFVYSARKENLASVSDEPLEVTPGETLEISVALRDTPAARLKVLDGSTSSPISGARVLVGPASASMLRQVRVTDDSGEVAIRGLVKGDNAVSVTADGFIPSDPATISPGDDLAIELAKGAAISGAVLLEDGTPVEGATVTILQSLGESDAMLNDGPERTFSERLVTAALSGWPPVYPAGGGLVVAGPPSIPLPRTDGAAARPGPGPGGTGWGLTDESGHFAADGLAAGTVRVGAKHADLVLSEEAVVTLTPGGTLEYVVVRMRRGARLSVRVLDEAGYPLEGAQVSVYDKVGEQVAATETERDGFARIAGLPGRFRVEASAEGKVPAAARISARVGEDTDVEIKLPRAGESLRGRVVDRRGYGVPDVGITARSITRGLAQVVIGNTEPDGTFALEGVGQGSYHVSAEKDGKILAQVGTASCREEIKLVLGGEAQGPVLLQEPSFLESGDLPPALPMVDVDDTEGSGGGVIAISHGEDASESIQTEYGQADRLVVTGPPSGKGGLPIQLGGCPGNVVVRSVSPGSLVEGAGLARGDKILTVDGARVKSPAHARSAISGRIGTVVVLEVDQGGEFVNIVVQRVRVR